MCGGHFFKSEHQLLTSGKNDGYLLPMIKLEISSKIYNFVKLVFATRNVTASYNKDFSNVMCKVIYLFFYIMIFVSV